MKLAIADEASDADNVTICLCDCTGTGRDGSGRIRRTGGTKGQKDFCREIFFNSIQLRKMNMAPLLKKPMYIWSL